MKMLFWSSKTAHRLIEREWERIFNLRLMKSVARIASVVMVAEEDLEEMQGIFAWDAVVNQMEGVTMWTSVLIAPKKSSRVLLKRRS